MKPGTGFSSGRPTNPAAGTTAVMRYLPAHRRPWLPHRFGMRNLPETDAQKLWAGGRFQTGYTWLGYATTKSFKLKDETLNLIPTAELERFMPNINLGPKAWVTPVTLMNARDGQRITHDLIHAYDPYIGRNTPGKKPAIDHDNITIYDPNRVGLHGNTMSCRFQMYRWLRRAPFQNEINYFFSTATADGGRRVVESEAEKPLIKKVIRLANSGQLKLACEEYRRLTFMPPVEVFRALLGACVPHGLIGDAVSIYTEGNQLKGMSRDYECLRALLRTAIAANNVERVMWAFTLTCGDWTTNVLKRSAIETVYAAQLHLLALEYLCDNGFLVEARTVYNHMRERDLLNMDLHEQVGLAMRAALEKGEVVNLPDNWDNIKIQVDATRVAEVVAATWLKRLEPHELASFGAVPPAPSFTALKDAFLDIDVAFVLRAARFQGEIDLLATNQIDVYTDRVLAWCDVLSDFHRRVEAPLPYLLKTKPSAASNENVRIAADPRNARRGAGNLLPTEEGHSFWYAPHSSRFVTETYPTLHDGNASRRLLMRQPVQTEVPVAIANLNQASTSTPSPRVARVVHSSIGSTYSIPATTAAAATSDGAATPAAPAAKVNANLSAADMQFS